MPRPPSSHQPRPSATERNGSYSRGRRSGLSLIRPDGSGNHVILGPPGDQVHPDWSPDGSQIAYVQRAGTGAQQILITDPQGTKPQPLVREYPPRCAHGVRSEEEFTPLGA